MKFDLITDNGNLWAVRYENCLDNVLDTILDQWNDVVWLRTFFKHNITDLASYFKITDERTSEILLGKEKARLSNTPRHASWLRIYAIRLEPGIYIITGGAIKLTRTMQEREHTLVELARMEKVRRYLIDNGISDMDSFNDYLRELI